MCNDSIKNVVHVLFFCPDFFGQGENRYYCGYKTLANFTKSSFNQIRINVLLSACDGPDWADPHNFSAGADTSWADPDVSPGSTNQVRPSPSTLEPGSSKSQVAQQRKEKAGVRRRIGSVGTASTEDAKDELGRFARIQEPRGLPVPSAPLECGTGEKTRTAAVPTRDEESRLREAEL
ncbi:hypothetical protein NDU88_009237 [Pleurodeles waltl]|uniref:Uncharacterized protein n=1 Tax=Pleurodeles waltl TaxID=8319 RepID=A0AAV7QX06_PLEWA|nr:hypothetical protein NDU88_009237 [Pleurodeles waltl]